MENMKEKEFNIPKKMKYPVDYETSEFAISWRKKVGDYFLTIKFGRRYVIEGERIN